jgi:Domain of unknown function (DUF6484)
VTHKSNSSNRPATLTTETERPSVKVGRLVDGSAPGGLLVEYDGGGGGPLAARTVLDLDQSKIWQAVANRQGAVLVFEKGDPRLPIVVGLLPADPAAALFGSLLASPRAETPVQPTEARVDGKRVVLEGQDEIVLKCGEASITLTRDGKLFVKGAYVETRATGVNRIKGGSVKIN